MDKDMDYKEFETYEDIEDFSTMGHIEPNSEDFVNDGTNYFDFLFYSMLNNG